MINLLKLLAFTLFYNSGNKDFIFFKVALSARRMWQKVYLRDKVESAVGM